jgi:4,5-dihydroxyphthalate decarboxylase
MARIQLSLAISDYDHVRDLVSGAVRAEGIDLIPMQFSVEEIFWRFAKYQEWDVSEMSSSKYTSLISRGNQEMTAIPVFPSRVFRCSSLYVRRDSNLTRGEQLVGKRIGIPEWIQTAGVYARGFLAHECGVDLASIEWYRSGVNQPGRQEKINFEPPKGVKIIPVTDRSLDQMLADGDLDAIMSAHPPDSFGKERGGATVVRLYEDFESVEREYWRKTGIFPIMHLIAIRTEVVRKYPWVPMNLFKAFEEAKRRSVERLFDMTASRLPIPWGVQAAARAAKIFRGDYWPYGIEPNRVTLEGFLDYCAEQNVSPYRLKPEDLFAKEIQTFFKI